MPFDEQNKKETFRDQPSLQFTFAWNACGISATSCFSGMQHSCIQFWLKLRTNNNSRVAGDLWEMFIETDFYDLHLI